MQSNRDTGLVVAVVLAEAACASMPHRLANRPCGFLDNLYCHSLILRNRVLVRTRYTRQAVPVCLIRTGATGYSCSSARAVS